MGFRPRKALIVALAIGANLIWALSYPISKQVMATLPPLALTCWRMAGSALFLLPFLRRSDFPRRIGLKDAGLLALMGIVGCALSILLQYRATLMTQASNIALIVSFEAVFVLILAFALLREPIGRRAVAGVGLAMMGVILITVDPETLELFSSRYFVGNVLMLLSVFCYAIYTIIGKKLTSGWGPTAITAIPFLIAALVLLPYYQLTDPAGFSRALELQRTEIAGVLFTVVLATGLTFLCWNWLLRFTPANELARSMYLQPVAGMGFSYWLLGEKVSLIAGIGGALVITGLILSESTDEIKTGDPRERASGG